LVVSAAVVEWRGWGGGVMSSVFVEPGGGAVGGSGGGGGGGGLTGGLDALEQFEFAGVLEFKCQNATE